MNKMLKEKIEHSQVKVTFDVTAQEFEAALDEAFKIKNKDIKLNGFRPGKAPRAKVEALYGVEFLYEEALNVIFNKKVQEALQDKELTGSAISPFYPSLECEVKRGEDFKVSLLVDVYPEFNLPEYKGIEAKAVDTTVTDEEVNNSIEALLKPKAVRNTKEEQVIANGDYAVFDFKGFVDDEAFEGGEAQNYELKIGSGQFIPGFEDQMVGMKAGETKDVLVKFPENYGASHLAGKDAKFVVTVHEVKVETLPELNDEFVKTLNIENVNTVEELKAHKAEEIKKRKEVSEKDRVVDEIINKILDNTVIDMPKTMVEERVDNLRSQYESQAKMYNIPFETFLQLIGTNKEDFEKNIETQGKRQALFNVVISKIIEVENLTPTKEEVEAKIAEANVEKPTQHDYAAAYSDIAYKRVIDMLVQNAKLV